MKNALKLFKLAVFVALIGFSFSSCTLLLLNELFGKKEDTSSNSTKNGIHSVVIYQEGMSSPFVIGKALDVTIRALGFSMDDLAFQWNKGGVAIDGATNWTYIPVTAGSYSVTVSETRFNTSATSKPVTVIEAD